MEADMTLHTEFSDVIIDSVCKENEYDDEDDKDSEKPRTGKASKLA